MTKELFYRKRWLVLKYNILPHCEYGPKGLLTPNMQKFYGSLTSRLFHYHHYASDTMGDKPQWTRTFMFGSKRPNYMMWNVGDGGHRMWNHAWQRYRVSEFEQPYIDLRGPEPR
eukprot:TRINITY_DN173_c2_g1_i2.p1 TRINITY_DN173_c2_g1~~TRINITY_DN173_c2_g1_i2.p1  ORF type:complete len:129 (+),score=3.41 TRINITY_DN173_c2_g1_i2:48-389(+)